MAAAIRFEPHGTWVSPRRRPRGQAAERRSTAPRLPGRRGFRSGGRSTGDVREATHHFGESKWKELKNQSSSRSLNACLQNRRICRRDPQSAALTVSQVNDLRSRMPKAGATVKVAKNRLAMLALDGTPVPEMSDLFKGPTMVAYQPPIPSRRRRSPPSLPSRTKNSSYSAARSAGSTPRRPGCQGLGRPALARPAARHGL